MEELTKQIKRDLFDIKENINNPDKLMELFAFKRDEFDNIIHNLKFSVEDSLFEYKTTAVNLILEPLDSLRYDSRAMSSFDNQIERARGVLAVTLIQRLIAVGAVKIQDSKAEDPGKTSEPAADKTEIKEIVEFVQGEPKKNPGIVQDMLFKKIIMHIKMYRTELQKMNELMAKVSAEKKIALKRNFNITLAEQVSKMRAAYKEIMERNVKEQQIPAAQNILLRFNFKPMSKLYMSQIEIFSKLLSTLKFAKNEKFNTRELLLDLNSEKAAFMSLIEKERDEYVSIAIFDKKGSETAKAFVKRIIEFLGKERDWLRIHPGK